MSQSIAWPHPSDNHQVNISAGGVGASVSIGARLLSRLRAADFTAIDDERGAGDVSGVI
jgi:hypothetical protein